MTSPLRSPPRRRRSCATWGDAHRVRPRTMPPGADKRAPRETRRWRRARPARARLAERPPQYRCRRSRASVGPPRRDGAFLHRRELRDRRGADHAPMRERQRLERARKSVDLSHAGFGAHLIKHGDRRIVGQRLLRTVRRPDHRQQADALRDRQRKRGAEFRREKR